MGSEPEETMTSVLESRAPYSEHTAVLENMAETLRRIAGEKPDLNIPQLLETAAVEFGTTASQMKYALSFARVKRLVDVDYDSSRVTPVSD
jgi:hypothetical protein